MNTASINFGQLVPAAANGDQVAFGRLVGACQNTVTSIAWSIVREVPASEDIAQDAFLSAWQNLRKLKNPHSFLPWLRQITRNLARDHLRAQRLRVPTVPDAERILAQISDPDGSPTERHADAQREQAALAVIDALPHASREVLLLFYREGQSSQQVADLLGMSDAAVRKRLSRARANMRAAMIEHLGEFARGSAPGAAFTALVMSALVTASPPAAAATVLLTGGAAAAKGAAKIGLGALLGGAGIGMFVAMLGPWLGMRRYLNAPFDARERRGLLSVFATSALITFAFSLLFVWTVSARMAWLQIGAFILMLAVLGGMCMRWVPAILAARHAHEAQRNSIKAAHDRHRERVFSWIGLLLGAICGGTGLLLGLYRQGLLG